MTALEDLFPIPPVEGSPGAINNISALNALGRAFFGYTPGDFAPIGSIGSAGDGAILPSDAPHNGTPGAGVHDNGPKLQTWIAAVLASGKGRVTAGIWNLESANGVGYVPVIDLSTAAFEKTVIEFDPGAIFKVPTALGRADLATSGGAYFTGATRAHTTIAAGSNTVNVNTFAGAGTLNVASTTGAPSAGTLDVTTGSGVRTITYTNKTSNTFTGCTATGAGVMSTGGAVEGNDVVLTAATGHGILAGDPIEVYGATWDYDNGDYTATTVTATTIVYDQGSTNGTSPDTTHAGTVKAHIPCFEVINGDTNHVLELIRPQFSGPSTVDIDPNAAPCTPAQGNGPRLTSRVETHGIISNDFFAGFTIDGSEAINTDHFHHYDILDVGHNFYGVYVRDNLNGTRDYRIDTGGISNCQRAGLAVSVGAYLPDLTLKDAHFNAQPVAMLKEGMRNIALPTGSRALFCDIFKMEGRVKAEGSANWAIDACEGDIEKWLGTFEPHGIEINGGTGGGGSGTNHTRREIALTALTRSTTIVSATYSRSSSGVSTNGSCIITGLTSNAFTYKCVGDLFVKADAPATARIAAILSTTSVLLSSAATGSSTSTCYSKPILQVGDHLALYTDGDSGATLDCGAIVKTLAGTGPFTLTAETVGASGSISSTSASAGTIGQLRYGTIQHSKVEFSTQSDSTTSDCASEQYWDGNDMDSNKFFQMRHSNAQAGYSAFPSINLRNGSVTRSLRTTFEYGDIKVKLVKVTATVPAGYATEIGASGNRKASTATKAHPRGGAAMQPAAATTAHADGAKQTSRPNTWVVVEGDILATAGWPGLAITGSVASGDLLVEDPADTDGVAKSWDGSTTGLRKLGVATAADSGGFVAYEMIPGEAWT